MHWFASIDDAQQKIDALRWDYNEHHPHRALKGLSPREFAERMLQTAADSLSRCTEKGRPSERLPLFRLGYSCGGVTSLVITPDLTEAPNASVYGDRLVRFYTGPEDPKDLICDLEHALHAIDARGFYALSRSSGYTATFGDVTIRRIDLLFVGVTNSQATEPRTAWRFSEGHT